MISVFLASFIVLALATLGMALGVLLNNRELKGSCGGLGNIPGATGSCSCANPCEKKKARMRAAENGESAEKITESPIEFKRL